MERLIQRRTDTKVVGRLALNKWSVLAPSGMSCGSIKANTRPLNRVSVTLGGAVSARGSCNIVESERGELVDRLGGAKKAMSGSETTDVRTSSFAKFSMRPNRNEFIGCKIGPGS